MRINIPCKKVGQARERLEREGKCNKLFGKAFFRQEPIDLVALPFRMFH